ncbi:MAG: putative baseplate assembly protein [Caldilineaceae bacterium]
MPFVPPGLDDRRYDDLVAELVARIPAHTPEWSNPREGDPGRTLIELFAWLGDALLYRANLIPERQRLAFLRLVGQPMRPAEPARTIVCVGSGDENQTRPVVIQPLAAVSGPANFETRHELSVMPVTAGIYYKRRLEDVEKQRLQPVIDGLRSIYRLTNAAVPYTTAAAFGAGAEPEGLDIKRDTVDGCLWLALLAAKPELVDAVRAGITKAETGGPQLLSIGILPSLTVPALFEDIGPRARIPHQWEVCARVKKDGTVEYAALDVVEDTTLGLTRRGVQRLALPAATSVAVPDNNVRQDVAAGVGDKPPRLDDPDKAKRLVAWLRLRPLGGVEHVSLSWVGINAVEVDQRTTFTGQIVGQSDGAANQQLPLPAQSVEVSTLQIQVEEPNKGYRPWQRIDDLALGGRDDSIFSLDAEAGVIQFGDGVRGRVPATGMRVRVALLRAGGGSQGNLPPGALTTISARDLGGSLVPKLKLVQPLPADGGTDPETLAAAEQRVPALFRHRDRCITAEDYKRLAADTPGVRVGRVEVLPGFRPQQRQTDILGVVSVMVLPGQDAIRPPNPQPDRPFLEAVHAYLDERRPLGTELYVIGCEYIPLAISTGVTLADGVSREGTLTAIRDALRRFLWPLEGGGLQGLGWPLGGTVRERELEVTVARVPGVIGVRGVKLFRRDGENWRRIPPHADNAQLTLTMWQLPELLAVVTVADGTAPDTLAGTDGVLGGTGSGTGNATTGAAGVAVPVVIDMCR